MKQKTVLVTILAGFLGAGKTTLLNNILREPQGHKIAVIVNDIGEINIDAELVAKGGYVEQEGNDVVPLSNGCICCTLQPDLIKQLTALLSKNKCDYIVIEASGICEPQPIAETVEAVAQALEEQKAPVQCRLDSIITVTDAFRLADEFECGEHFTSHGHEEEEEEDEEEEDLDSLLIQQIEFCSVVLLNKTDLVTEEQKKQIIAVIKALNPGAIILEADHCKVDISSIVDMNNFDINAVYRSAGWARAMEAEDKAQLGHDDDDDDDEHEHRHHDDDDDDDDHDEHGHGHHHHHHDHDHHGEGEALEYGINTCVFSAVKPLSKSKFEKMMPEIGRKVIRSKGFVWFDDMPDYMCIYEQCGKQLTLQVASKWIAAMPLDEQRAVLADYPEIAESWNKEYGDRLNRIVFIGQGISDKEIQNAMNNVLA